MGIIAFLNQNNGAIMVIITAIYVIATILICVYNRKSAEASKKQISESQHQFKENQRLQVMPYLQFKIEKLPNVEHQSPCIYLDLYSNKDKILESTSYISIKNIGVGIAHHLEITLTTSYKHNDKFPANDIILTPSDERYLFIKYKVEAPITEIGKKEEIIVNIKFEDVLGNIYKQEAHFWIIAMREYVELFSYFEMSCPQLVNENNANVKCQNKHHK